jgi:hypothetical protein
LVKHVTESLGWIELCMSENQVADRARFIDAYDKAREARRYRQSMPPDVKRLIARLQALHTGGDPKELEAGPSLAGRQDTWLAGATDDSLA